MIRWDVDPEFLRIGFFSIYWYTVFFTAAFVFGYFIMRKIFKHEGVSVKKLDHLIWYMALGTFVGARLGHCLFYEPDYFLQNPLEILLPIARDDYGIYKFVGFRGLASHGAGLGILTALYLYSRIEKTPYLWILDRMSIVVALSGFFIRLGNLTNSEIFGYPTDLPWGFEFVRAPEWYRAPINQLPCHPTQIYEALAYLAIFAWLFTIFFRKNVKKCPGSLLGKFLVSLFTVRFLIEFFKIEQASFERNMTLNMGQLLSIPFILCGIFLLCKNANKTSKIKTAFEFKKLNKNIDYEQTTVEKQD